MSIRDELEEKLGEITGLARHRSRFGHAFSFFVGSREIAHFHGDGRLDVRLTREWIRAAKAEGTLDPRVRTRGPSADWATVPLHDRRDVTLALILIEEAMRANA